MKALTIYTIGHSTRSLDEFFEMLRSFDIRTLVDVRSFHGSRKFPHFNKENLRISAEENGVEYIHILNLGGRRPVKKDSKNTRWHNDSFKGYADYMETKEFGKAVVQLEQIAIEEPTAYMCSEAVWWRCHRSMISDYLKVKGWTVLHIMGIDKVQEHPYTKPARIEDGQLVYTEESDHQQDLFA